MSSGLFKMADLDNSFQESLCGQCLGEVFQNGTGCRCDSCGGIYHKKCLSAHATLHVHSQTMEYLDVSIILNLKFENENNKQLKDYNENSSTNDRKISAYDRLLDVNSNSKKNYI